MGYRGLDCSVDEQRNFTIACSNDCSGHGVFDIQLQTCQCQDGWLGRNCEDSKYIPQTNIVDWLVEAESHFLGHGHWDNATYK